ncbi:MAG TPA: Gfo/Idh/MocA family oxidoreductase [Terrimicrobiaceae bacterium]|nr:Gfo/Idh/MocA family oxidoreductase [Terrimicrobiaceae bacterium]
MDSTLTTPASQEIRDIRARRGPLRVAVIGTNGCARSHHEALGVLEAEGHCEVVGTCDPWACQGVRPAHVKPGMAIHPDHRSMLSALAGQADYVVVPTPIHLHGDMHRDVLAAGFACYLEKPPTLDPAELEAMLKVEAAAPRASFIGFSHLFRPEYSALKARILGGEFGPLREVELLAMWPRTGAYFQRNSWAGRLRFQDRLILDSCLGNGMAHHVHNCLFWCGADGLWTWGRVESLRAHLYRINRIEAPDSVFLEARSAAGVRLRMALSHACSVSRTEEVLRCERATIRIAYGHDAGIAIEPVQGAAEHIPLREKNGYVENHRWYADYLLGRRERPCTLLSDCRALVELNALTYVSAGGIQSVPPGRIGVFRRHGDDGLQIHGVEEMAVEFLHDGLPPDFGGTSTSLSREVAERELPALVPTIAQMLEARCLAPDGRQDAHAVRPAVAMARQPLLSGIDLP